jgi:molybdate transport system substrate-binding protein
MANSFESTVVSLWSALVVRGALDATVIPAFAAEGKGSVIAVFDPTTVLMQRIAAGELPDIIISTTGSLKDLPAGTLVEGSIAALVRTGIGIGVAEGAAAYQIETVADLTAALLASRSVAYSRAGQSGIHFASLIQELGIADEVNAKATILEKGFTGEAVIDGRADLAIQQISELRFVPGIAVVGPLPEPVQVYTDFSVAVTSRGAGSVGAHALHAFLTGQLAQDAYVAEGLQLPAASQA